MITRCSSCRRWLDLSQAARVYPMPALGLIGYHCACGGDGSVEAHLVTAEELATCPTVEVLGDGRLCDARDLAEAVALVEPAWSEAEAQRVEAA